MYLREDEKDLTMQNYQPWCMDLGNYMEENAPAREVDLTTVLEGETEYMVPKCKTTVNGTFCELLLGDGDEYLYVTDGQHSLYEEEPIYEGHNPSVFRFRMMIPAGKYELGLPGDDETDVIFAIYKKGTGRPLSCRYVEIDGGLITESLYESHSYGEYFILVANINPSAALQPLFTRMGDCWRYDFSFLPNGLDMEHPEVSACLSDNHQLQLTFNESFHPEISRFMVQCYDADYRLIGLNNDLQLMKDSWKVFIRPNGTFAWPEECCHILLFHNLVPFVHIFIRTEDNNPVSAVVDNIDDSTRFYWLGTEVGCDRSMTKQWNAILGNRAAKEKVLDSLIEIGVDDYKDIGIPLENPDMDALVCFCKLIYPGELVETYDVEARIANNEIDIKSRDIDPDDIFPPVRVLCVTNTQLFDTEKGKLCQQAVKMFGETEGRAVIYQE